MAEVTVNNVKGFTFSDTAAGIHQHYLTLCFV